MLFCSLDFTSEGSVFLMIKDKVREKMANISCAFGMIALNTYLYKDTMIIEPLCLQ